ncbi:MAG: hypothetical protein A2516_05645 [Alphaproteobacteria bacterium RIFOXYD12_FULL_60_8]|nr:MAG: hypothetical protein A2516_05645 [Alphaproteobacteria bacterium RIFOXYD12_FULL_60_8]
MHRDLLSILICPICGHDAPLGLKADVERGEDVVEGSLHCAGCGKAWPVVRSVPRFVSSRSNYADNFSFEWNRWGRVQMDRFAGHTLSTDRFIRDSRWDRNWMEGKLILDAGCGAGRFADVAASQGARVVAVDLSAAVDACRINTADHGDRVQVVQASFYAMPFRQNVFDGLYCMGVIQHTPDPEKTMRFLPRHLKAGGRLVYNWYEVCLESKFQPIKYALRLITPFLPHKINHGLAALLTTLFFPITWALHFIPKLRLLNIAMPICASHNQSLTIKQQFIWTLLDTFDWYSPRYENRQRKETVKRVLMEEGLLEVEVADGLAWALKG